MRGVPEIAILAGTGVLASGKVWKEAKASLVVQPYGSASSPSLAASCAISPVRARSCGTGKRAGIPRLKKCFTLFGCAKPGAIAGETLYIYTRSVLIMMIVTPPSVWSIAPPGTVVRIASFSKSLAPGLRLGYLTADASLTRRLIGSGVLDSGGGLNPFTALTVAEVCAAGDFEATVTRLRAMYRERRDALAQSLRMYLPPRCRFTVPGGGFFQWVELPEGVDAATLLPRAEQTGVSYLPGSRFYLDAARSNTLRLSFSLYPPHQLTEAARRLGEALAVGTDPARAG